MKIKFTLLDKLFYTFITFLIFLVLGVGVYATSLTPGQAPNPGHLITEIAPPSPCSAGQFLGWNGTLSSWFCAFAPASLIVSVSPSLGEPVLTPGTTPNPGHIITEVAPPSSCLNGQFLQFNSATWACASFASSTTLSAPQNLTGFFDQYLVRNNLVWQPVTGAAGYNFYRNGTLFKSIGNYTYFIDDNITKGSTYSYTVTAYDQYGAESGQSNSVTINVPIKSTTPPTVSIINPVSGANLTVSYAYGNPSAYMINITTQTTSYNGISYVNFWLANSSLPDLNSQSVYIGTAWGNNPSLYWNGLNALSGNYNLIAVAYDIYGYVSNLSYVTIHITDASPFCPSYCPASCITGVCAAPSNGTYSIPFYSLCTANGGIVFPNDICQLNDSSCPLNWIANWNFSDWATTTSNTCNGGTAYGDYGQVCTGNSCTTGSEPWSNTYSYPISSCNYNSAYSYATSDPALCPQGGQCTVCATNSTTCYANIVQVGCTIYPTSLRCTNAGGTWDSQHNVCQFGGSACPSGWNFVPSWTTTIRNTCDGTNAITLTGAATGCYGNSCTTGYHAWNNLPTESCSYNQSYINNATGACSINQQFCYANVTQVGCLPA